MIELSHAIFSLVIVYFLYQISNTLIDMKDTLIEILKINRGWDD